MEDAATPTPPVQAYDFNASLADIKQFREAGSGRDVYKALVKLRGEQWKALSEQFEAFKTDTGLWNGMSAPTLSSELYQKINQGLNFTKDIMGHPFRAAFMQWALEKPYLRDYLKTIAATPNEDVHYDKFRADMLEAFGQDLLAAGNSTLFNDVKNHSYVSKRSDGSWQRISEGELSKMLQASGKDGPNIMITANHAYGETMADIDPIVNGYEKLIDEVGKAGIKRVAIDSVPQTAEQTILVAACQTRENNFLNLAQLFHRLYEIDEANTRGHGTDRFEHSSPIARMMVRTVLKAIARDAGRIEQGEGTPPQFVVGEGSVKLREDAAEILRHAQFHGFSKGGNDFRDGLRLLAHTLNQRLPDGTPQFQGREDAKDYLRDIVSNVSVTVQSLNEKPMDDWYKQRGVAVTYFSNKHDVIAPPPGIAHSDADSTMTYHGREKDGGHHPAEISENLSHPYIRQHYRCAMASLAGKPALRFVLYEKSDNRHCLVIKTASGTTDEMMEKAIPVLEAAFNKVELHDAHGAPKISVKRIVRAHGCSRYQIVSALGEDDLLSRGTIMKLNEAFDNLRLDDSVPIVVSSAITDPCLPTLATNIITARRGYEGVAGEDWKDRIKITGGDVYDRRMAQINKFMGAGAQNMPGEPPVMSGASSLAR